MKVFQNKFFLVCLCIALILCTVSTTFSLMGYREPVREVIGVVSTPFRWVATVVTDGFDGIVKHFQLQGALIERNEELEEENDRLKDENLRAQMLEEENERLRSYLGMKDKYPTFLLEEGRVIGAEASDYITVFTLNRGSAHGIAVNMPVIVEKGIVGKVTEVGLTWCKVTTILESSMGVGALSENGSSGVVQGDYVLAKQGLCKMKIVDDNSVPKAGELILSMGVNSIYPANLIIGTVEEIKVDEYSRETIATVRPTVDFSSLKYVLIITGYETTGDGYQKPITSPSQEETTSNQQTTPKPTPDSSGGFG